jgi:hypothetical protein
MKINDFRTALRGGGARPNRFRVTLFFPAVAQSGSASRTSTFLVKAAQLPASTLGNIDVPYMGRMLPLPGDRTFEDWNVTVLNDTDFGIRNALERWSNAINGNENNQRNTPISALYQDLTVEQLDLNGDVLKTYTFKDAYPLTVAAIDLDMGTNDSIEEFATTFKYTHWTSNTTT